MHRIRRHWGGLGCLIATALFAAAAETRLALEPARWEVRKNSAPGISVGSGGVLTTMPDSLRVAFGLAEKTAGCVEFADLRVTDQYEPPRFADGPPALTRPAPPSLPPEKYVRLASANGAWWLVDPAGRPFFSNGSAGAAGRRGEPLGPVAAQVQADLYNLPFVVGAHWFIWRDIDTPARQANRGLFRADGRPWPELTQALAELNLRLPQL